MGTGNRWWILTHLSSIILTFPHQYYVGAIWTSNCASNRTGKILVPVTSECKPALHMAIWSKNCPQIFNHLAAVFAFALRNLPELIIEGCMTTKGRVKYDYKAFGSVALLFIEFELKNGTPKECLNMIAQVIAECDGEALFFCMSLSVYSPVDT